MVQSRAALKGSEGPHLGVSDHFLFFKAFSEASFKIRGAFFLSPFTGEVWAEREDSPIENYW